VSGRVWPRLGAALIVPLYGFLLAPLVITIFMSFSNDSFLGFPPSNWGVRWYHALLSNERFLEAFQVSLMLAVSVMSLALLAGVPAAYAVTRFRFPGRDALFALFTAPLLLPAIVLGLALLIVFVRLGLLATWPGLTLAHLVIALPYVVRISAVALSTIPPELEEAALSLGATPWRAFRRVTLPLMVPGLVGCAALSFLLSFDEIVISLFLVGPNLSTLPVEIYRYVEYRTDPQVAALSVVLICITMGLVLLVERTIGVMRALGR